MKRTGDSLQARSLFNRLDPGVVDKIGDLLAQALEIDPEYVPALLLYTRYLGWGGNSEGSDDHWTHLREIINRALAIDPKNGYALSWQGWIAMNADNDLETAARYFMRSHEVDPTNYDNLLGSINTAQLFARPDLSIGFGEYMIERDPLCLACYGRTAHAYWMLDRLEEAEARVRTALALDPGWTRGRTMLGYTFLLSERPEEALAVFERLAAESGGMLAAKAMALHDLGRDAELQTIMEVMSADSSLSGKELAQVFAWIGDKDTAFELLLGEVGAIDSVGMRWVLVEPYFSKLHNDPRWQVLLEEYGMSAAQLDAIDYNPRLPE